MARGFNMQEKLLAKTKPLDESAEEQRPALAIVPEAPAETEAAEGAAAETEAETAAVAPAEAAEATEAEPVGNSVAAATPLEKEAAGEKRTAPKRSRPAKRPVSEQATEHASAGLALDVEPALDARLMAYRASTRMSLHHIVLDAVEQTYPNLPTLVAKALGRGDEAERPKTSLFQRSSAPSPLSVEGKSERVTHTIRIARTNREMLDQIADEVGAPSRNFMLCVALDEFLPPSP